MPKKDVAMDDPAAEFSQALYETIDAYEQLKRAYDKVATTQRIVEFATLTSAMLYMGKAISPLRRITSVRGETTFKLEIG